MKTQTKENWCQKQLANETLQQLLEGIDLEIAEEAHAKGCCYCGKPLHWARYPRKPRGGPNWDKRFSFCCSEEGCRRRLTPPSVRFLGRRVYAGLVVVLVSAMNHGLSGERVQRLREVLGIDRRTLQRWRQWWLETFVRSKFWKVARAQFIPPLCEKTLPWSLCQSFKVEEGPGRLVELLKFLRPLSVSTPEIQAM